VEKAERLIKDLGKLAENAMESGRHLAGLGWYDQALKRYEIAVKALELVIKLKMIGGEERVEGDY